MTEPAGISSVLEVELDRAWPVAPPDEVTATRTDNLDPALLAVTPPLNDRFEEMRDAIADRRVIIVRQGGTIMIGTLVAILGSIAIHGVLAVLVFVLWKLIIFLPLNWGPDRWATLANEGGHPGTTFTMLGEGDLTGTDPKPYLGAPAPAMPVGTSATMAPLALASRDDWPALPKAAAPHETPPLIGLPTLMADAAPRAIRAPMPPRPPVTAAAQATPAGPVIVGPAVALAPGAPDAPSAHGTAAASGTGSSARVGGPPGGDSMEGDNEPTINIMRGSGGHGNGSGSGNGDGIDRGGGFIGAGGGRRRGLLLLPLLLPRRPPHDRQQRGVGRVAVLGAEERGGQRGGRRGLHR